MVGVSKKLKKKIKDLTLLEANKYCLSHKCEKCLLSTDDLYCYLDLLAGNDLTKDNQFLNKEIEIEEEK